MRNAIGIAALIGAAAFSGTAQAQTVGINAAVVNDVRMTSEANRTLHQAVVRERVSLGNDILTGRASRLQLLLLDRTSFTVGPNARIRIDRFVYDPSRNASSVGATIARGAFRFMSGKPTHANPGQSGIRTPTASMGIRGTIVEGAVGEEAVKIARAQQGLPAFVADPETATLILLRGPGAAAQGGEIPGAIDLDAGGKTVSLTGSGYALFIPGPDQAPIGPFLLSDWGSAYLASLLGGGGPNIGRATALAAPADPLNDLFFFDELCLKGGTPGVGVDPVAGGGNGGLCGGRR